MQPYCFVITSFDRKPDLKDLQAKFAAKQVDVPLRHIDFDNIYAELIKPAIQQAGLEPLIEKEEESFGSIHKTMYEKIILCEFCVADLTNANPNVYYELGMRYAVRPYTTIPIIASSHFPLPFDIGFNRTFVYKVDDQFNLQDKDGDVKKLAGILQQAIDSRAVDSPLYDLVNGISFQNSVAHEKTDVFRDKVNYDEAVKKQLAYARAKFDGDPQKRRTMQIEAIHEVVNKNKPLARLETGVLIDMMISYRNVEAFAEMLDFIRQLPRYVRETIMVREQYAFALNRVAGKQDPVDDIIIAEAEDVLKKLEKEGKASSETYGIWGRIHKDKFERAYRAGKRDEAKVHLNRAKELYEKGFLFDLRDAYPGVNYVTCLELMGNREKALRLLPVVEEAVLSKMRRKEPDYWDYATLLEIKLIEGHDAEAEKLFHESKLLVMESWMPATTKGNIEKIMHYRKERGEDVKPLEKILSLFG